MAAPSELPQATKKMTDPKNSAVKAEAFLNEPEAFRLMTVSNNVKPLNQVLICFTSTGQDQIPRLG